MGPQYGWYWQYFPHGYQYNLLFWISLPITFLLLSILLSSLLIPFTIPLLISLGFHVYFQLWPQLDLKISTPLPFLSCAPSSFVVLYPKQSLVLPLISLNLSASTLPSVHKFYPLSSHYHFFSHTTQAICTYSEYPTYLWSGGAGVSHWVTQFVSEYNFFSK